MSTGVCSGGRYEQTDCSTGPPRPPGSCDRRAPGSQCRVAAQC